jgi:hypothetical protein
MRKILSAIPAFLLGAGVPTAFGLISSLLWPLRPDQMTDQYLIPSEAIILIYGASIVIGSIVGAPVFLALKFSKLRFWGRLTLTGIAIGIAAFVLLRLGTVGANRPAQLWVILIGVASSLVFGAVWTVLNGRLPSDDARS